MTYDIYFHNSENSNNKGFRLTWPEVLDYIIVMRNHDKDESYWNDYKGGVFQIVCNETQEVIFESKIK